MSSKEFFNVLAEREQRKNTAKIQGMCTFVSVINSYQNVNYLFVM